MLMRWVQTTLSFLFFRQSLSSPSFSFGSRQKSRLWTAQMDSLLHFLFVRLDRKQLHEKVEIPVFHWKMTSLVSKHIFSARYITTAVSCLLRWLFEDYPRRSVAHADDIYAAVDAVASHSFGVVDGIYGGILISSGILNCVRRYGQDGPEVVPIRCRLVGVQWSCLDIENCLSNQRVSEEIAF